VFFSEHPPRHPSSDCYGACFGLPQQYDGSLGWSRHNGALLVVIDLCFGQLQWCVPAARRRTGQPVG